MSSQFSKVMMTIYQEYQSLNSLNEQQKHHYALNNA